MESSEHGLISQRQFVPKCQFLASRPLGCCSFQNILTNPIISQINTVLLPYFISYYSFAFTINQFHNDDAEVYAPQRLVSYNKVTFPFMPIPSKPYTMPLGLGSQINSAHGHASHFLLTSLLSLNNYEMKCPNCNFI